MVKNSYKLMLHAVKHSQELKTENMFAQEI